MSFTDDELKRLKAHNSGALEATDYAVPQCTIPCGVVNSLLARLEAAEALITDECDCDEYGHATACLQFQKWRKAAGK